MHALPTSDTRRSGRHTGRWARRVIRRSSLRGAGAAHLQQRPQHGPLGHLLQHGHHAAGAAAGRPAPALPMDSALAWLSWMRRLRQACSPQMAGMAADVRPQRGRHGAVQKGGGGQAAIRVAEGE